MSVTWVINQLDRDVSDHFVTTVHYSVNKEDEGFFASIYGTVSFDKDKNQEPLEYASLTEEQVISWVQEALNKEVVEAALASQINAQKNPVKASGLPWATNDEFNK